MTRYFHVALLLDIFLLINQPSFAQNNLITGEVKDPYGRPAQNASIQLMKQEDSSVIHEVLSDTLGSYAFNNIQEGSFIIMASFTGMEKVFTSVFQVHSNSKQINADILYFRSSHVQLKNVTVLGKKQLIEQKADRMVIHVNSSITYAGGTALDVLEKSPGVTLNRQSSSIAVNGKNGVSVMINGKITYMPPEAMVQFLAGLPANNIERIELITAPPSKYDAAGSGGYINIVLLNNPYSGLNGSYFLTAGYNNKPLGAAGVNVNFRSSKINVFGNYSFKHDHYIQPLTNFARFSRNADIITNNSFSNRNAIQEVQNIRVGMDYQLDSSNIVGAFISGYNSRWTMIARSGAVISKNNRADSTIYSVDDPEMNLWQNVTANINFQHNFKAGKVLYVDANYIHYKDNNPNTYSTDYHNSNGDFLYHEHLKAEKITPINFRVFSADYIMPIGKNITTESGAKMSFSSFTNYTSVSQLNQGASVIDTGYSAKYILNENTGAWYTLLNFNLNNSMSVRGGLRYEYTTSNLVTAKSDQIFNRKSGQLFPTVYFSEKFDADNTFNFTYSRRITRPAFNDLAPFTVFFDPKTFYSGNPLLQPAIANTVQAGYAFRKYSFTISYTYETNTIDNFYFQTQRVDTVSGISYLSARNFNYEKYLAASFSLPFSVTRWWTMQNNLVANRRVISTSFDKSNLLFKYVDFSINSTQHVDLPKDFSFETTGYYASASYRGTAKIKPIYQLDAGLQKKFKNNGDVLRCSASDIFNSGTYNSVSETLPGTGTVIFRTSNFGIRAYRLTYTHNFGNKGLKSKRERTTGAEDELKRVHY